MYPWIAHLLGEQVWREARLGSVFGRGKQRSSAQQSTGQLRLVRHAYLMPMQRTHAGCFSLRSYAAV